MNHLHLHQKLLLLLFQLHLDYLVVDLLEEYFLFHLFQVEQIEVLQQMLLHLLNHHLLQVVVLEKKMDYQEILHLLHLLK